MAANNIESQPGDHAPLDFSDKLSRAVIEEITHILNYGFYVREDQPHPFSPEEISDFATIAAFLTKKGAVMATFQSVEDEIKQKALDEGES